MRNLVLPDELEIVSLVGSGRRSDVYKGCYQSIPVAIKIYKKEYIEKYLYKYKVDIGEFEYERNTIAYRADKISRYIAKPYLLLRAEDGFTPALVQEFVEGTRLLDLLQQEHRLPKETLEAGYMIVKETALLGLYDLDISPGNIQLVRDDSGQWIPKLYDFNLMPQHLRPPNPFMRIGFWLGLRSKNHRDYRSLRQWEKLGRQAEVNNSK